ncbi:MAG: hypothetical protein JWL98_1863 [Xanthomonadaceae bacterium]|nr:hypothetical protein [Xanthomonadaceae bacterium]
MNDMVEDLGDNEEFVRSLRALRRDVPPGHDLWPQIATRIGQASAARTSVRGRARTRLASLALAASLVLAVLLVLQHPLRQPHTVQDKLIASEAQGMTREYQGALRVLLSSAPEGTADDPTLRELDRSAAQIRSALARDPDARFLLDRLQHTYTLRLALTQRAAMS